MSRQEKVDLGNFTIVDMEVLAQDQGRRVTIKLNGVTNIG